MTNQPSPVREAHLGDVLRRKAIVAALICILALPLSALLFSRLADIWMKIMTLDGASFTLASIALGGALAILPLAAVVGLILGTWWSSESIFAPRSRPSPLLDRLLAGWGVLVTFAPALAFLTLAIHAVATGRIHFVRPPRDYFRATDPIAFWQGVGFWLIFAAGFAYPGWRYWRSKLIRP